LNPISEISVICGSVSHCPLSVFHLVAAIGRAMYSVVGTENKDHDDSAVSRRTLDTLPVVGGFSACNSRQERTLKEVREERARATPKPALGGYGENTHLAITPAFTKPITLHTARRRRVEWSS